ncbi:MAG TPA: hypothetical protein VLC55_01755 [Burkholderiales bacterium]|nr:hypothetical protein [Burkholderiales bacterium]
MKHLILSLAGLVFAGAAHAHDYPTVDRVEYVVECMRANGGEYQYLYRCSCVIDAVAKEMSYDDYVESSAVARYQGMAGERMGVFRDADSAKDMAKKYRGVLAAAKKACDVAK